MKDRIKQVRKSQKLTQSEFGEKLGVKGNTVTGWETGIRVPSEVIVKAICKEYHINENWLRTGDGVMEAPANRDAEIAAFMGEIMASESEDFRRRLVAVLCQLDVEEWKLLQKMAEKLAEEVKKDQA